MLKLAGIFQDNMVIQRNKPIQVWGTGTPGTIVTVSLFTATADTMVCADGSWKIALQPLCAGAGYTLVASDTAESIVIQNVAVGEVWLAGGQSNMELALKDSENGIKISEEYSGKNIRFYQVPKCSMLDENQKEQEENSTWQIADNRNVGEMSAIAFYFASRLSETLHCIVGIIDCYWGGSSITCWMSKEQLAKLESGKNYLENYAALVGEKSSQQYTKEMEEYNCAYQHWLKSTEEVKQKDPQASWKEIHKICGECPWPQPVGWQSPFRPNGLHETMIRRIAPYSLRGFLYYQGEEDVQRYADYSDMMQMLVKQWRMDWNDWNLPFLFVQLPMYLADGEKDDSYWALQREQQYIASMMIQNLADFMRIGLNFGGELISISKELAHVQAYVNIMNYRFSHKICFTSDIPKELLSYEILKIILQPLVENSIRHGFGLDNSSSYLDVPSIKIEVYRDDPWLYLRVIDNGSGIDIERATQILHTGTDGQKHVGLNNVYQRLVFFYGETVKITFSSIPYYENIVQIRIPFIYPIPDFEEEHH